MAIKLRRMSSDRHVGYERRKGRDQLGDVGVDGRIILKQIFEKCCLVYTGLGYVRLAGFREYAIKPSGNIWTSWVTI
jgi:hypothetical protein